MTWSLVIVENILMALIPLLIGFAIDGLLAGEFQELFLMTGVLILLTVVAVLRRIYDTRAYGTIRVALGNALIGRNPDQAVSTQNARLDMARELVDFLEEDAPEILTAVIQIAVALIVLYSFHAYLTLSAVTVLVAMIMVYSLFHGRFYRLNAALNEQMERQVSVLEAREQRSLSRHLSALRLWEVRLSDTEALVYGLIFVLQIVFIAYNLWLGTTIADMTAGRIFSIVAYSWEYVEAAIVLPIALQSLSRLREITNRLNGGSADPNAPSAEMQSRDM